jgi:hypothetical protein
MRSAVPPLALLVTGRGASARLLRYGVTWGEDASPRAGDLVPSGSLVCVADPISSSSSARVLGARRVARSLACCLLDASQALTRGMCPTRCVFPLPSLFSMGGWVLPGTSAPEGREISSRRRATRTYPLGAACCLLGRSGAWVLARGRLPPSYPVRVGRRSHLAHRTSVHYLNFGRPLADTAYGRSDRTSALIAFGLTLGVCTESACETRPRSSA